MAKYLNTYTRFFINPNLEDKQMLLHQSNIIWAESLIKIEGDDCKISFVSEHPDLKDGCYFETEDAVQSALNTNFKVIKKFLEKNHEILILE